MNGDVRIDDHSHEYFNEVAKSLDIALESIGIHIEGESKEELENTPRRIDTGNLRNSINHEVVDSEKAVYIGTNVEYAIYVTCMKEPRKWSQIAS